MPPNKLNRQQVETILKNAPKGTDPKLVLDGLILRGYELEGVDTAVAKQRMSSQNPIASTEEKKPSLVEDYNADAKSAFDNAGKRLSGAGEKIADTIADPTLGTADKVVKTGAEFFKGIGQFIGGGAIDVVKTLLPQSAEDYVAGKVEGLAEKAIATAPVQNLAKWYTQLTPEERKGADNVLGYAEGLAEILAVKGSGRLASKLLEIGEQSAKKTGNKVLEVGTEFAETASKKFSEVTDSIKGSTKTAIDRLRGVENPEMKVTLDPEKVVKRATTDPAFDATVKEAQKQGFRDADINFLSTVSETDKPIMKKMFDLSVKAQSNPRQIERAGDVLGDNVLNQVKQVQKLNSEAGKAVDVSAKSLKGQAVDATPLQNKVLSTLGDAGIEVSGNKLNFTNSVFKNVPKIQKEIQKVFASIPDGSDAYQMHIFKKGLDEILDFGTAGEGLSGQASRILKSIRTATDDVLDTNFKSYNEANTAFKETKEFLDEAISVAGKNADLSTKEGAQAFGQSLRSAFSNNKSRGATLTFIENLQKMGKKLGLEGAEQDILDQAIFVTILEETFGSAATTGLAGEVTKAINTAKKVVNAVRNPITGTLDAVADLGEKLYGVTPEAKKNILDTFLAQVKNTPNKQGGFVKIMADAVEEYKKFPIDELIKKLDNEKKLLKNKDPHFVEVARKNVEKLEAEIARRKAIQ